MGCRLLEIQTSGSQRIKIRENTTIHIYFYMLLQNHHLHFSQKTVTREDEDENNTITTLSEQENITTTTISENITTIITPTTTDAPIRYHPFKTLAFLGGRGQKLVKFA